MDKNKKSRVRDLFVWQSASRPDISYPKGAFLTLGGLITFLTILFVLFQEWLAICVTWAAYFLFFALTRVPRVTVEHKITTEGIISLDHSYIWQDLGPFWFTTKNNERLLHIASKSRFSHMIMIINSVDEEKLRDILAEYLPFIETPEKSAWDKFLGALGQN